MAGLFYIAVGMALIAALLNAALDFCLGCEMYVALLRLLGPKHRPPYPGHRRLIAGFGCRSTKHCTLRRGWSHRSVAASGR